MSAWLLLPWQAVEVVANYKQVISWPADAEILKGRGRAVPASIVKPQHTGRAAESGRALLSPSNTRCACGGLDAVGDPWSLCLGALSFFNDHGELVLSRGTAGMVSPSRAGTSGVGWGCGAGRGHCGGDTWRRLGGSPIAALSTLRLSQPLCGRCQRCLSQCSAQARPSRLERPPRRHVAAEGAHPSWGSDGACGALPCHPGCRRPSQAVSM